MQCLINFFSMQTTNEIRSTIQDYRMVSNTKRITTKKLYVINKVRNWRNEIALKEKKYQNAIISDSRIRNTVEVLFSHNRRHIVEKYQFINYKKYSLDIYSIVKEVKNLPNKYVTLKDVRIHKQLF